MYLSNFMPKKEQNKPSLIVRTLRIFPCCRGKRYRKQQQRGAARSLGRNQRMNSRKVRSQPIIIVLMILFVVFMIAIFLRSNQKKIIRNATKSLNEIPFTLAEITDPDAPIDGAKGKPIPVTNWGQIYGPLRVWCFVNALYDEDKLMVIQRSWGRYCDKIMFFVDKKPGQNILENEAKNTKLKTVVPIPLDKKQTDDLWEKIWKSFVYLEEHHHGEYDYIIKGDTDSWISVNNFKSYAQYYDPALSWYMGHTLLAREYPYQTGANYALSAGAVERLVDVFRSDMFLNSFSKGWHVDIQQDGACKKAWSGWHEDEMLGVCLRGIGVHPLNTLNEKNQLRFSPMELRQKWDPTLRREVWFDKSIGEDGWYFLNRVEDTPVGKDCCDENMIGLHRYKFNTNKELLNEYLKLDEIFQSDKMKVIPVPQKPTTFLFGGRLKYKNKDIVYRHH